MADHHPLGEGEPLVQEGVPLDAGPDGVRGQGGLVRRGQARVHEEVMRRGEHRGQAAQEGQLLAVALVEQADARANVLCLAGRKALLLQHLLQEAGKLVLLPQGEEGAEGVLLVQRLQHPQVAVADHPGHGHAAAQVQQVAQRREALRPLFHDVAHEQQEVLPAEGDGFQQATEQGQVAVHVGDGDDAPARHGLQALNGGIHGLIPPPAGSDGRACGPPARARGRRTRPWA